MNEIKNNKSSLNGQVVDHDKEIKQNASVYKSPIPFYIKNGFMLCAETRIENEKIAAAKINWKR